MKLSDKKSRLTAADVNGNGVINSADLTLMARALAAEDAPYYKALAWKTAASTNNTHFQCAEMGVFCGPAC